MGELELLVDVKWNDTIDCDGKDLPNASVVMMVNSGALHKRRATFTVLHTSFVGAEGFQALRCFSESHNKYISSTSM